MRKALALDIGGTKIYSAIVDENGEILSRIEKTSTPKQYEGLILCLKNIIHKSEKEVDTNKSFLIKRFLLTSVGARY